MGLQIGLSQIAKTQIGNHIQSARTAERAVVRLEDGGVDALRRADADPRAFASQ
jgi:hypothetical protein